MSVGIDKNCDMDVRREVRVLWWMKGRGEKVIGGQEWEGRGGCRQAGCWVVIGCGDCGGGVSCERGLGCPLRA